MGREFAVPVTVVVHAVSKAEARDVVRRTLYPLEDLTPIKHIQITAGTTELVLRIAGVEAA